MSYDPAKFGCNRHYGSGDIMVLVCHVILQDCITNGLSIANGLKSILIFHDNLPQFSSENRNWLNGKVVLAYF